MSYSPQQLNNESLIVSSKLIKQEMYHTGSNVQEGLYFHEFCEWNSVHGNKLSSVGFSVHRQPKVGWERDYKESPMHTQYM